MKKQIIEEVKRLQEIMGVKKELITEERILSRASRWLSDVINGVSVEVPKVITRVGTQNAADFLLPSGKTIKLLSSQIDEILRAISNGTGLRNLTNDAKKAVKEILSEFGYLDPKFLYNDYVDEVIQAGGDEEKFFKSLQRRLQEVDPTTRTNKSLKQILNEFFPDDPDFVDEIFPFIDSKLDDYSNGLLKNRGGKLVREISPDIQKFIKDVIPLTTQEIQALSKSSWLTKTMDLFKKGTDSVEEIKRLMKTLDRGDLNPNELLVVEQAILEKMNKLYNFKLESEKYMEKFIKELGNSKDKNLIELKDKLESIKPSQGWNVARQVMSETSWMRKRWKAFAEALQQTMSLEKGIYKYLGPKKFWDWATKNIRKIWSGAIDETAEKAKEIRTGSGWNIIFTGSRRGFPKFSQVVDEGTGIVKPDYYEALRKIGRTPLAWESYGWEWFMRSIKWKLYYAFFETLVPFIFLKNEISEEDFQCALSLSEVMKKRNITRSDEVFSLITDNQTKIFPDCIKKMVDNDQRKKLGDIVFLADYLASPGSETGYYFLPQLKESFLRFSGLHGLTTVFPGFLDDIFLDMGPRFYKYIKLYDVTGANVRKDNEQDSTDNPPPTPPVHEETEPSFKLWCQGNAKDFASWDNASKVGKTQDGKQYKLKADKSTFDPITVDNTIDTVEELLTTYPFLRGNNSEITLNTDNTFNEKLPEGRNLTIKIIDGKAYYTQSNGVDITPPFEIKES